MGMYWHFYPVLRLISDQTGGYQPNWYIKLLITISKTKHKKSLWMKSGLFYLVVLTYQTCWSMKDRSLPQEIRSPSKSERKVESLYFKIPKDSLAKSRGGDGCTWGWGSRLKVTGKWQSSGLSLENTSSEDQWVFRALTPLCWLWLVRTAGCLGNLCHLAPSFIDTGICLSGLWPVYVFVHFHQIIIRKASELRRNKWVHDLKLEKTFSFQRLTRETVEFLRNHTRRELRFWRVYVEATVGAGSLHATLDLQC